MQSPRTNAICKSYTGTAAAVKILESDPARGYIAFYAVSGSPQIVIGPNTFADNAITIPEGIMWEPRIALTGEVWLLGLGAVLTVLT